jgi:hypothetical protein
MRRRPIHARRQRAIERQYDSSLGVALSAHSQNLSGMSVLQRQKIIHDSSSILRADKSMAAEVADAFASEATDALCWLSTSSTAFTDPQLLGGKIYGRDRDETSASVPRLHPIPALCAISCYHRARLVHRRNHRAFYAELQRAATFNRRNDLDTIH